MTEAAPSKYFPPADAAEPDGLVLFGGALSPEWLLDAYRHGIFPWPVFDDDELLAWWSPDPRAILDFDDLVVSKRLQRTCRSGRFTVTCDRDFRGVLQGCATAQDRAGNTWLGPSMIDAYVQMFKLGHAHSIEVCQDGQLVGGTYGIAIGGFFAAESKFYHVRDASKVALVYLVEHLKARGYRLLDIQQLTDHTQRLGAKEIPRVEYLRRLADALRQKVSFGDCLEPHTHVPSPLDT